MKPANKIVVNTGILYVRMFLSVLVSLFSTRIILNSLGAADFGLFNVIGGLIGLLAFLNAAMSTSTQRYLSVSMGAKDSDRVRKIFGNSVIIHLAVGILLLMVFEIIGSYLLEHKLKIDFSRLATAKILFHFTIATTFFTIISVPYDAVMTAHENILVLSILDFIDSILRLGIAIFLSITSYTDKLLLFGFLVMLSSFIIRTAKRVYCRRKYRETNVSLRKEFDIATIKELSSYGGWNLFGAMCSVFGNQGVSVVLNIFFGTIINAAYGIANQINSQLLFFSQSMMRSIRPQMMKNEGAGNREKMLKLSIIAGKFSFFLFSFFFIPLYIEMPAILGIWLKNVPENTILFSRLILILSLIRQFSMGIMSAIQSIGKIKVYQFIAGTIQLLTVPVGYIFLHKGYPAYSILVVAIVLEVSAAVFRVYYFNYLTDFSIPVFLSEVVKKPVFSFILTFSTVYFIHQAIALELLRISLVFSTAVILYAVSIYFMGMGSAEQTFFKGIYNGFKQRIWAVLKKSLKA